MFNRGLGKINNFIIKYIKRDANYKTKIKKKNSSVTNFVTILRLKMLQRTVNLIPVWTFSSYCDPLPDIAYIFFFISISV